MTSQEDGRIDPAEAEAAEDSEAPAEGQQPEGGNPGEPAEAAQQRMEAPDDNPGEQEAGDPAELELARVRDQLLRTAADFENFRRRARRDLEEAERRGREGVLREILPVVDNLERAVSATASAKDVNAVAEGVRMVLKQFEDVASKLSLERVQAVGERFDPSVHDAVQQMETAEHPPGTIVAEVVPGYRLGDRLLRAALVVVARPPSTEDVS